MKKIAIFLFTGTGNTGYVTQLLKKEFETAGCSCEVFTVTDRFIRTTMPPLSGYDTIGIAHPIHAFETPCIVYELVKALPASSGTPVFILKTCGEGTTGMNGAVSKTIIHLLKRKGYLPFYERSFAMGSNWLVRYDDSLVRELARVAKDKVRHMSGELLAGKSRLLRTTGLFHLVVRLVYLGYRTFFLRHCSKDLYADKRCTTCGRCVRECPRGNIAIKNGKVRFGWRCISCMRCLYRCPQDAINYRFFKPLKVKGGYDLPSILAVTAGAGDTSYMKTRQFAAMAEYLHDVAL